MNDVGEPLHRAREAIYLVGLSLSLALAVGAGLLGWIYLRRRSPNPVVESASLPGKERPLADRLERVDRVEWEPEIRLPWHDMWILRATSFYVFTVMVVLITLAALSLLFLVALGHAKLPTSVLNILSGEVVAAVVGMAGTVITGLWRGTLDPTGEQ